jgi:hypothetical protein
MLVVAVTWGTWAHFTVGDARYRMPLSPSFVLIGFFLWLAENVSTLFEAYRYPDQADGWSMVHVGKFGSWALLVVVSFVLVAKWKTSHLREESLRHPSSGVLADEVSSTASLTTSRRTFRRTFRRTRRSRTTGDAGRGT